MYSCSDEYLEIDESTYQFQPRSMKGKSVQEIAFSTTYFGVRVAMICGNSSETLPITSDEFFDWLCACYHLNPKPEQAEMRLSGNPQKDRKFYFDIQSIYDKADGLHLTLAYQKIVELAQKAAEINGSFDEDAFAGTLETVRDHRGLEKSWIADLPQDDKEKEEAIKKPGYAISLFRKKFVDKESGDFAPLYKGGEYQGRGSGINIILSLPKWYYYVFRNQSQGHHIPSFIRFVFLFESAEERLKQENAELKAQLEAAKAKIAELEAEKAKRRADEAKNLSLKRLLSEHSSILVNRQQEDLSWLEEVKSYFTTNSEIQPLDSVIGSDKLNNQKFAVPKDLHREESETEHNNASMNEAPSKGEQSQTEIWDSASNSGRANDQKAKRVSGKESETEHNNAPTDEAISKGEKSQTDTQEMKPNMKLIPSNSMPQHDLDEDDIQMH